MARQKVSRLRRNFELLKALHKSKPARRKELLKAADKDLVESVCDCAKNVLNGNIHLNPARKRTLAKHKKVLRELADPGITVEKKAKIFKRQKGGFIGALLPALLGPVLSAVGSLVR